MNIKHLGSQYGGYYIDVDSVNDGDFVLSLGIGEDHSFDEALRSLKSVNIIAVDPTEKSLAYNNHRNLDYITFINKAIYKEDNCLISLYRNKNPNYVSDSIDKEIKDVGNNSYQVETISIKTLIDKYNPTLIKMDIEGAEYMVYKYCLGVKQICLETHDYRTNRDDSRDKEMVDFFIKNDYRVIHKGNHLFSFLRDN